MPAKIKDEDDMSSDSGVEFYSSSDDDSTIVPLQDCPPTRIVTTDPPATRKRPENRRTVSFRGVDDPTLEAGNSWSSNLSDVETGSCGDLTNSSHSAISIRSLTRAVSKRIPKPITKGIGKVSGRAYEGIDKVSTKAYSDLFGDAYSKKEGHFILLAGALIAFNSGFVNGTCVSGLLFPTGETQVVAGYAASYTDSAFALLDGNYSLMGFHFGLIGSYAIGALIAGLFSPDVAPYQIQPTYGPTFLVGGVFLLAASLLAAFGSNPSLVFFLAAAANGIQNGIASIYSANLIRCSLTGTTTDAAIICAQVLRGNKKNTYRGIVLFMIVCLFWLGSLVSFYATQQFLSHTLLFNATLFWLIGLGLVYFLVKEIGVSVRAALYGDWQWKRAMKSISSSIKSKEEDFDFELDDMFDQIDADGSGTIEPEELLVALQDNDIKIGAKGIKILMKTADQNGDGLIDREEWAEICEKIKNM